MPTSRFQKLDPERRRELLAAAAEDFALHGYEAASVNRILERVGSSKGALYYWFEDKADLYRTVLQDCLERFAVYCGLPPHPIRTPGDFWTEVERLAEQSLRFYRDDRVALALIREFYAAPGRRENAAPLQDFHEATRAWSRPLLALGHEVGAIRRDLPDDLLLAVAVGMTEGLDAWLVSHAEALTDDEVGPTARRLAGLFQRLAAPLEDS